MYDCVDCWQFVVRIATLERDGLNENALLGSFLILKRLLPKQFYTEYQKNIHFKCYLVTTS